ncbi:site-specific integrase, partial [bacterium]|nr:site-specific integrase [bacterium]
MTTFTLADNGTDTIKVSFTFEKALLPLIKSIPGRMWDNENKFWAVPKTRDTIRRFRQTFSGHTIRIDPALNHLLGPEPTTHGSAAPDDAPVDRREGLKDRRLSSVRSPATERRRADLAEHVSRQLRARKYSPHTVKLYKNIIADFSRSFSRPIEELSNDDLTQYILHLIEKRDVSTSRVSQVVCALKFMYGKLFDRKDIVLKLDHPRKDKKLPKVLDRDDVLAILNATQSPKHRLILEIMYSSGLRVSEVARIKVTDINLSDLSLSVRAGKGRKDRQTMLSEKSLNLLKVFMAGKSADDFLFEGKPPDQPISPRTIQKIFNQALIRSGIQKKASCHTFRHSFASHL